MRDFAWALGELRAGERMQRTGWDCKGMFLTLQAGYPMGIQINANTADAIREPVGSTHRFHPYFMVKVNGGFIPWTATTTDLLAEDWQRFSTTTEAPRPAEAVTDERTFNSDGSEGTGDVADLEPEDESDGVLDYEEDDGVLDPAGSDGPDGDGPAPEPGSE